MAFAGSAAEVADSWSARGRRGEHDDGFSGDDSDARHQQHEVAMQAGCDRGCADDARGPHPPPVVGAGCERSDRGAAARRAIQAARVALIGRRRWLGLGLRLWLWLGFELLRLGLSSGCSSRSRFGFRASSASSAITSACGCDSGSGDAALGAAPRQQTIAARRQASRACHETKGTIVNSQPMSQQNV